MLSLHIVSNNMSDIFFLYFMVRSLAQKYRYKAAAGDKSKERKGVNGEKSTKWNGVTGKRIKCEME